jgi:hypothetical protein
MFDELDSEANEALIKDKINSNDDNFHDELFEIKKIEEDKRSKRRKCFFGVILFMTISILLLIYVIIPLLIQDMVDKSGLEMQSILITNPSDTKFTSTCVQKFSNTGSLQATALMKNIKISWEYAGGGTAVELTDFNEIVVGGGNDKEQTLTSTATIINNTALSDINIYAVSNKDVEWHFTGDIDVTYFITVNVRIDKYVTLYGYDSFPIAPIQNGMKTWGGSHNQLYSKLNLTMYSSATIEMELGQTMYFNIINEGIIIALGSIPNYSVHAGPNSVEANITLVYNNDEQYNQVMKVFSNYTSGFSSPVNLVDFYTIPSIPWLQPSLDTINMNSYFPSSTASILHFYLYSPINPLNDIYVKIVMYNGEDVDVNVQHIYGKLFYQDVQIGYVDTTNTVNFEGVHIPPKSNVTTIKLLTTDIITTAAVKAYKSLVDAGGGLVDTYDLTIMNISSFVANFSYVQRNVELTVIHGRSEVGGEDLKLIKY